MAWPQIVNSNKHKAQSFILTEYECPECNEKQVARVGGIEGHLIRAQHQSKALADRHDLLCLNCGYEPHTKSFVQISSVANDYRELLAIEREQAAPPGRLPGGGAGGAQRFRTSFDDEADQYVKALPKS